MALETKTIAIVAIVVLVIVVMASFFILQIGQSQSKITECESNGGVCGYSCESSIGVFKCGDALTQKNEEGYLTIDAVGKPVCCMFGS